MERIRGKVGDTKVTQARQSNPTFESASSLHHHQTVGFPAGGRTDKHSICCRTEMTTDLDLSPFANLAAGARFWVGPSSSRGGLPRSRTALLHGGWPDASSLCWMAVRSVVRSSRVKSYEEVRVGATYLSCRRGRWRWTRAPFYRLQIKY